MNGISIIDAPILFTAIIAGVSTTILFLYPIVSYVKEFNSMNQTGKTYMEIFVKTFGMQFAILLFMLAMSFLWNAAVGDNDKMKSYSFRYGTALFYGYFDPHSGSYTSSPSVENGDGFWSIWQELSDKGTDAIRNDAGNSMSAGATKAIGGGIIVINMATTILWIALLIFPPFCVFTPALLMMRKDSNPQRENSTMEKCYTYSVLTLAFIILGYLHSTIASVFISAQVKADFSFWDNMVSIWSGIMTTIS